MASVRRQVSVEDDANAAFSPARSRPATADPSPYWHIALSAPSLCRRRLTTFYARRAPPGVALRRPARACCGEKIRGVVCGAVAFEPGQPFSVIQTDRAKRQTTPQAQVQKKKKKKKKNFILAAPLPCRASREVDGRVFIPPGHSAADCREVARAGYPLNLVCPTRRPSTSEGRSAAGANPLRFP